MRCESEEYRHDREISLANIPLECVVRMNPQYPESARPRWPDVQLKREKEINRLSAQNYKKMTPQILGGGTAVQ